MQFDFNHFFYHSDTLNRTECLTKCGKWQSLPGVNDIDTFVELLEKVLTHKENTVGSQFPGLSNLQAHLAINYNYTTNEFQWREG